MMGFRREATQARGRGFASPRGFLIRRKATPGNSQSLVPGPWGANGAAKNEAGKRTARWTLRLPAQCGGRYLAAAASGRLGGRRRPFSFRLSPVCTSLLELLDAAGRVDVLHLAGEERMARRADFDGDVLLRAASRELVARKPQVTVHSFVFRVNVRLSWRISLSGGSGYNILGRRVSGDKILGMPADGNSDRRLLLAFWNAHGGSPSSSSE